MEIEESQLTRCMLRTIVGIHNDHEIECKEKYVDEVLGFQPPRQKWFAIRCGRVRSRDTLPIVVLTAVGNGLGLGLGRLSGKQLVMVWDTSMDL